MPTASCTVRNLGNEDPRRYLAYAGPPVADVTDRFDRYLDSRNFRPEWLWVAERGEVLLARAAFWGRPDGDDPLALDHFDVNPDVPDGVEVGAELLRSAYATLTTSRTPDYHLFLPPDWRGHPEADAVRRHINAAELAGFNIAIERHRLEWTPECPWPARDRRLTFRGVEPDDAELLVDLFMRVISGSLDTGTVQAAAKVGNEQASRDYLADMYALDESRQRWLLGVDSFGDVVGVVMAADAPTGGHVGFVGVAAEQRGRGYGVALLAEVTHRFAAAGATVIRADTDQADTPMIGVLERSGWRVWGARMVMQK